MSGMIVIAGDIVQTERGPDPGEGTEETSRTRVPLSTLCRPGRQSLTAPDPPDGTRRRPSRFHRPHLQRNDQVAPQCRHLLLTSTSWRGLTPNRRSCSSGRRELQAKSRWLRRRMWVVERTAGDARRTDRRGRVGELSRSSPRTASRVRFRWRVEGHIARSTVVPGGQAGYPPDYPPPRHRRAVLGWTPTARRSSSLLPRQLRGGSSACFRNGRRGQPTELALRWRTRVTSPDGRRIAYRPALEQDAVPGAFGRCGTTRRAPPPRLERRPRPIRDQQGAPQGPPTT